MIASTATGEKLLPNARAHFRRFMDDFGRRYADDNETRMRFEIFKRNLQTIDELNAANENAIFGITKFADLTDEERGAYTGFNSSQSSIKSCDVKNVSISRKAAPDSWDWREHGAVTRVKNSQNCCSCWAFAAIGTVEGQYAIKNGKLLELSEQQLQDCYPGSFCSLPPRSMGAVLAFIASKYEGGVMSEEDYPYINGDLTCAYDRSKIKTNVTGCALYKLQSEDDLKELLYSQGPLAVALIADSILTYKHGIIQHTVGERINYDALLVGYGTENGVPYWIMKNSWGADWGEKGYFRAERGTNQLGMMRPDGEIVVAVL